MPNPSKVPPATAEAALAEARELARRFAHVEARAALARAEAAAAAGEAGPLWAVKHTLARAELLYFESRADEAIPLSLGARAEAERLGDFALAAECAACTALQMCHVGRDTEAVAQALAALALAPPNLHPVRYRAFVAAATALQSGGDAATAYPLYRRAMAEARAAGDSRGTAVSIVRMAVQQAGHALWCDLHGTLDAETLKQAIVGLESALRMIQPLEHQPDPSTPLLLAMLQRRRGQAGDLERADAGLALWGGLHRDSTRRLVPQLVAAERACCALARGDREAALGHLHVAGSDLPGDVPDIERMDLACIHADRAQVLSALDHADAGAEVARAVAAVQRVDAALAATRAGFQDLRPALDVWTAAD